ncbi:YopX family protein [Paenibacillus sp. FSL M7-0547]|uniref:YopX family protein n=1 Tax=Paenibacillus sp. FSL M7-0547 TaxID=2954755 RepID=UPI0030F8F541
MSRQFKFRVWDILGKRMLQWGDIFNLPAWEIFPGTPEQRAFNVMQYTGLKDKNGREIYEGDFIQNENTIGEIEWVQEHCAFMAFTRNPSFYRYLESDGQLNLTEIIGNIYENPELIEV